MPPNILQTINTQNFNFHLFLGQFDQKGQRSSLRFHFHQANINVLDEVKNGEGAEYNRVYSFCLSLGNVL